MNNIMMYGAGWCADCIRAKHFFKDHNIAYEYHDIDQEPEAIAIVEKYNTDGTHTIPVIVFADGSYLIEPSYDDLSKKMNIES